MSSKSINEDVLDKHKNKDVIQNNISAILSNGIHCSYLLNTMTNPSTLPYSNYAFGGSGSAQAQNNKNNSTLTTTTNSPATPALKPPANTASSGDSRHPSLTSGISTDCHQNIVTNMNSISLNNTNPMYVYQYPQHQHHHYHLFQMAQQQQHISLPLPLPPMQPMWHYPLNPFNKYNNHLHSHSHSHAQQPYMLNPYGPASSLTKPMYDLTATTTPMTTTNITQTQTQTHMSSFTQPTQLQASDAGTAPKSSSSSSFASNSKVLSSSTSSISLSPLSMLKKHNIAKPSDYFYGPAPALSAVEGTKHEMRNALHQIVSIPDEFTSHVTENFTEMIGMQDIHQTISVNTIADRSILIQHNIHNEEKRNDDEAKWQNEEFISKRKQQIIKFLKLWDNSYPVTAKNGEFEAVAPDPAPTLPPGLHQRIIKKKEGESLGNNGNNANDGYLQSPSYVFHGSFEEAILMGSRENKWIMLNIQDTDWFTAQWSNPLIWKHKRYGLIIKQNFIFFNQLKIADNSIAFINLYDIQQIPSVCIIDPYTNLKRYEFNAPSTSTNIVQLRKDIVNLLNTFPSPSHYENENNNKTKPTKPPIPHKYIPPVIIHPSHHSPLASASPLPSASTSPLVTDREEYSSNNSVHTSNNSSSTNNTSSRSPISPISPARKHIKCQDIDTSEEEMIRFEHEHIEPVTPIRRSRTSRKNGFHFTSSLEISEMSHIYCSSESSSNIWDLSYPYSNLKNSAYVLSTRQTFDWNDWMLIIQKCRKIIGAIPAEQHIEFLRNRNAEMTLESSGTYNGWWSEKRIAEFVVNEKFGLSYEGGFASENGRERKKFLKSLELPRRPTFKKMLVIVPDFNNDDKILFHDNSLSITAYLEYDKMDNITSFQLWLSFITFLSVNMFETSLMYKLNKFKFNECTNFCIKLGSKWKLPLTTLYNDMEPLINNSKCKNILFSYPKIATDATTHHCSSSSSSSSSHSTHSHHHILSGGTIINKYHHLSIANNDETNINNKKHPGFEISFLSKSNNVHAKNYKYDCKRTMYVKSYEELEMALSSTQSYEVLDFPFPLFSSGWFSFNTLSLFATILEEHLNGTWVSMFSLNSRKQFKQIFEINKNTRRRSIVYSKLLQQKVNEEHYKNNYVNLSTQLSSKNKQRLVSFWNENKLYWTDLIIDKSNKRNINIHSDLHSSMQSIQLLQNEVDLYDDNKILHKNHNNRNYRKKKPRFRNRNRTKRKQNKINNI